MTRKFTKYPSNYVKASMNTRPRRYMALLGFNTKQLWLYDEETDEYIDPPSDVLDALPAWNLVDGSDAAERELARIANEEQPDWLFDLEYRYSGNMDI